jgi:hypothetical protein
LTLGAFVAKSGYLSIDNHLSFELFYDGPDGLDAVAKWRRRVEERPAVKNRSGQSFVQEAMDRGRYQGFVRLKVARGIP